MKNKRAFGDPMGAAIWDFAKTKKPGEIIVHSDICEDDIIPTEVLFRGEADLPKLEQTALSRVKGSVLDVGAGAGPHATILQDRGHQVHCIDTSKGAVDFMNQRGLTAEQVSFFDFDGGKYDTQLFLMNGLGLAGTLSNLEKTLQKAARHLNKDGRILCDSSDIQFLYMDDDGSMWIDLNSEYYGNFRFNMSYKKEIGPWFDWLYVDFDNLFKAAKNVGLRAEKIDTQEDHYLAEITFK